MNLDEIFEGKLEKLAAIYGQDPHIGPTVGQIRELLLAPDDDPVLLLTFIQHRNRATYTESSTDTGQQAFMRYGATAIAKITERGGRLLFLCKPQQVFIGDRVMSDWDTITVVQYPNRAAYVEMLLDPEYIQAHEHRKAGLARMEILINQVVLDETQLPG